MRGHNTYLYLHSISTCARRNFQTVGEAYPFHDRCLFLHLILLPSSCVLLSFLSIQSIVYCGASVNPHRNKFVDRIAFLLRILYGYTVTTVYSVQTFPHKCGRQQLDGWENSQRPCVFNFFRKESFFFFFFSPLERVNDLIMEHTVPTSSSSVLHGLSSFLFRFFLYNSSPFFPQKT